MPDQSSELGVGDRVVAVYDPSDAMALHCPEMPLLLHCRSVLDSSSGSMEVQSLRHKKRTKHPANERETAVENVSACLRVARRGSCFLSDWVTAKHESSVRGDRDDRIFQLPNYVALTLSFVADFASILPKESIPVCNKLVG